MYINKYINLNKYSTVRHVLQVLICGQRLFALVPFGKKKSQTAGFLIKLINMTVIVVVNKQPLLELGPMIYLKLSFS